MIARICVGGSKEGRSNLRGRKTLLNLRVDFLRLVHIQGVGRILRLKDRNRGQDGRSPTGSVVFVSKTIQWILSSAGRIS